MNYSTYRFTLDLKKHNSQMSIAVFQYDSAVQLIISLTDGGKPYFINGCEALFYGKRADGAPINQYCEIEGEKIIYKFDGIETVELGAVNCQILLSKDGKTITAPRFTIMVEPRVITDDEIIEPAGGRSALDAIFASETAREEAEAERAEAETARAEAEIARAEAEEKRKQSLRAEWDHVITTIEDFAKIKDYTGTVLVKGLQHVDLGAVFEEDTIDINASYVKFIDCAFYTTYPRNIVGNENCTIDGFYWRAEYDSLSLSTFGKVINCKHTGGSDIDGYPLEISNCDYVHNCDFGAAYDCNHISDCALTVSVSRYEAIFSGCNHIHGVKVIALDLNPDFTWRTCIFDGCKYISNVSVSQVFIDLIEFRYISCLYVDPDTCAGFLPSLTEGELNDEVQILTRDGSFKAVHLGEAVAAYVNGTILTGEW